MRRICFFMFLLLLPHTLFAIQKATKADELPDMQQCYLEQCRAHICIYVCNIHDISFNRYVMRAISLEAGYAAWLEITRTQYFPQALPQENYTYKDEETIIAYTWTDKSRFTVTLHERDTLVGELLFYAHGKNIIVDDKVHCVIHY